MKRKKITLLFLLLCGLYSFIISPVYAATCTSGFYYNSTMRRCVPCPTGMTGIGTAAAPYTVSTLAHLQFIALQVKYIGSGYFIQVCDIDASETAASTYNSGAGFASISGFSGNYNGNGYVITGLYINRSSTDNVGLFGSMSGTVERLGITNATINGGNNVGAIVGNNTGSINLCYCSGSVVNGTSYVGGLSGFNNGTISNCFSFVQVTATNIVGGFAGYNANSVTNCYSTGNVVGSSDIGGFVGYNTATITSCYYDNSTSGCLSDPGATGYSTAQMKVQSNYSNWDFSTTPIWKISATNNDGYPYLAWQIFEAEKTTPVITWSNPADITYGTALSATQLNATADVPGEFVYSPAAETVLNVGDNQELTVAFTPTDAVNYETASDTVYINVKSGVFTAFESIKGMLYTIFPNPVTAGFSISGIVGTTSIVLTDLNGKTVLKKNISDISYIPVDNISSGMYILLIQNKEHSVRLKLVKQ
ncbi:MAG: T9SS type A sorting domain-containing protein [Paludibacter sp.]|nr:T9SS type A sorting domain-containing protein [Paludibacter sp.]